MNNSSLFIHKDKPTSDIPSCKLPHYHEVIPDIRDLNIRNRESFPLQMDRFVDMHKLRTPNFGVLSVIESNYTLS